MGYLRFILAFLVLISHMDKKIFGLNPGVSAVVVFYLLAGHVVSHLWENVLPKGRDRLHRFFLDRILRIMPLYLYVVVMTLVFLVLTGYGDPRFSVFKMAGNLLVIPLNYYMALDFTILSDPAWCLIPPAWSLGTELQAYLLMPLILLRHNAKKLLACGSLVVYLLANLGVFNPDYFGYRLIFGVFFIFAVGTCLQATRRPDRPASAFDRIFPWAVWALLAVLWPVFQDLDRFSPTYTRETFIGLLAGIPLVYRLGRSRNQPPLNALLGSLSYGLFLGHFLVIWLLDQAGFPGSERPWLHVTAVTLGSTLIALVGVWGLERHVDRIRK